MKNVNKLLSCLGVTIACLAGMSQAAYAAVAGHVQFVNGDVQITNPAGQTRPAQKGEAINEGDTLTSAPSASAQIKMQDGGFVAVRADTKLKFDQFIFAGKQDGNEKSFFSLFKGGFRAVTGLIGQINKQNYKITTPAATIGIRGTDHETFLIVPGSPLAQIAPTGAYNKVNVGETSLTTDRGTINVLPNQMGFAGGMNQAPQLQPVNTKVFTVAEAPAPQAKAEKKEEKKEEKAEAKQEQTAKSDKEEKQEEKKEAGKEGGGDSKQADKGNGEEKGDTQAKQEGAAAESKPASAEQAASTSTGQASDTAATAGGSQDAAAGGAAQGTITAAADTAPAVVTVSQEPAPIRVSAVVDAVPPSAGLIQTTVSPVIAAPTVVAPVIAPPPAPTTVVNTAPIAGGVTVNITTGTATTNTGQVITITQGLVATQAQTAADAALVAATAAQTAANTATTNNTTLAAVTQVSTVPAITAIGTATTDIGTASTAVTVATAINLTATLATATANATTAQTAATSAAAQALAAQNALTANATFADATAGSANTATQNANGSLQTANTAVQTEAGNVSVQNTALTTAQGAASTALASANTNLTTASTSLNTASAQNAAIVTAQGSTATPLTAAQTAAANAQTAATAAQAAATQAASLQAAGDLAGAQAQLSIAQQEQVFAEQQLAIAQTAQTTVANQLAAAQAAATAASTAVTAATSAATTAAADAATAGTQASAAQTAANIAAAALAQTDPAVISPVPSPANIVAINAPIVAANAPIAAYNNPNILSLPGASHNLMASQPVTGGWLEVWDTNYGVLNTQYVLDGNKNLVEMRSAGYSTYDQTLLVQGILNANIKFTGGVAQDTYVAPDSSIYMGRWQGGGITVTDMAATPVAPFTTNLGASSAHWVIGQMVPGVSLVQSLVGTTNYTMSAFTKPTDSFGNVGTVTNATLSANFTAQTVASAATFTFSTADPVNTSAKNQVFAINQTAMPIFNSGFNDSWPTMTTTVSCSGADCGAGTWSAWLYGDFAGATASSAYVDYALFNRANPVAAAGGVHTDMVQSIIAFNTTTAPAPATNPPAGNWESFSHLAVGSAGAWQRGRFNMGALSAQPNTSFILDGAGNLVSSLHVNYNERTTWQSGPATNAFSDATVTYSGGVASDRYTTPDGSLTIGRWTGGQLTIADNLSATTLVQNLGATSAYWALGSASAMTAGYVQSLVGTTTYTQGGATLPTDTFGNVGTVPVATLSANFTNQTIAASVAFTIAAQNLTVSATGVPIVTTFFDATLETLNAPTVACTGAGCSGGGYLGWMTGAFNGATAASADLAYKVWPTAAQGSLVSDIIQGIVALYAGTAPSVATNPPAGTWSARGHMLLGSTAAGWQRGRFNAGNFGDLPHTNFILDGTGNLVRSLHVNYNERYTQNAVSPAANQYADAMVAYSGGVASDHFTDGSVAIGRWTGGQMTIVDNLGVLPTLVKNLGVTSSYWFMTFSVPVNYVQSLVGTTTYTQFGATLPTDSLGNVGTLPVATLSANFTNQTVAASVAFTIANQGLNISNPAIPIVAGTEFFEGTLELGTAPTVACTGTGCSGGGYLGWLTGGFAGAQAASANLAYKIWPTAPADSLVTDLIQGVIAFNTATAPTVLTGGPFAAYVPNGVTVALSSLSSGGSQWWDSFTAAPADIAYTGGLPSGFTNRWGCPGCGESGTTTVLGAASPISALATSNAVTGIEFGRWTTSTAIEHSYAAPLGTRYGAPDSWMYGPQGYLDTPTTTLVGTFNYQLDGNTAPHDRDTGLNGTLTSATLTANFTAMTVSAALGLSMPGGETWAANITNQPVYGNSFSAYANAGGAVNTLAVTRNGAACPTCGGNLMAGFTGQNYAGAILSYQLYDHAASGNVVGKAALTRTGVVGNPVVGNATPVAPTNYFVADYGGSLQWVDAITATGNLLTAYSNGTPGTSGYSSTTVTCTTCTTAATGDVGNSGIYYGTWQAGGWTNTWGSNVSPGQFHWITGPEAGPVYLPEVLTGTVTYALDGGTAPTNLLGTAGTLNTATLTVNFTKQVVGISLNALVAGNTWNASTTAGNEAPLDYNTSLGRTAFYASSYQGGGPGTLTVSVSNVDGTLPTNGWVSGNLTGSGLSGAVLSYNLNGYIPTASFQSWDQINGVAAFVAPPSDIAAPYRMVGVALTDPTAAVPLPSMAGLYNAEGRMTSDATGNLTKFDISPVGSGSANSLTVAPGTSTLANFGSDPLTGISWGRWQGGVIDVTDRATGVVTPMTLQGSAHWIAGPTMTAPVTLPVSGTFAYTLAGNTLPTDNLGNVGTLGSATLSANFTAQTVDVGVSATVNATTLGASATGVPIMQGAAFGAGTNMGNTLAVTCAGTCGAVGSHGGVIAGGFTGAGATGAGMMYSLGTGLGGAGATVISGVAAFQRGAIP